MQNNIKNTSFKSAITLTTIFLSLSIAWIILSDRIIYDMFHDAELITEAQTLKGWLYVFTIGALFFLFSYRALEKQYDLFQKVIKSREEGEKEILRERELFHAILNRIPVMIVHYGKQKEILFVNRIMETISGWTAAELKEAELFTEIKSYNYNRNWRELSLITKKGQYFDSEWTSIRLDDNTDVYIGLDIREQKKTMKKLKKTQTELRSLAVHMNNILEKERTVLSREIHDELGQTLTVLKIKLSLLAEDVTNLITKKNTIKVKNEFDQIDNLINNAVKNVNQILSRLRPETLDAIGLLASIESLVSEFKHNTAIEIVLDLQLKESHMGLDKDLIVYRIIQEALTNVARHSQATCVWLNLKQVKDSVLLKIKDNGVGIDSKKVSKKVSFGLIGMRERAMSIGGQLTVDSNHKGTEILVKIKT